MKHAPTRSEISVLVKEPNRFPGIIRPTYHILPNGNLASRITPNFELINGYNMTHTFLVEKPSLSVTT